MIDYLLVMITYFFGAKSLVSFKEKLESDFDKKKFNTIEHTIASYGCVGRIRTVCYLA